MNTDSPINYPCPTCLRPRGEACIRPLEAQDLHFFHMARRAARMAALAKASAPPDNRYRRAFENPPESGSHRRTYIDRPNPTLPFDSPTATPRERWEQGVLRAVDMIFETMDGRS